MRFGSKINISSDPHSQLPKYFETVLLKVFQPEGLGSSFQITDGSYFSWFLWFSLYYIALFCISTAHHMQRSFAICWWQSNFSPLASFDSFHIYFMQYVFMHINIGKPKKYFQHLFIYLFIVCNFVAKKHMCYTMTCISFCSEDLIECDWMDNDTCGSDSQRNTCICAFVIAAWAQVTFLI